ncbi:MAG: DUF2127 domain-containing protein [Acidobacteria bacterium]|nr:DUF2127 domain-containing protein [Acidobacteriota bacterium]
MNKPHLRYKNQTPKERDWTIHIIAVLKFLKGVVLLVVGIKLLTLLNRDVAEWAMAFVNRHGIDAENRFVHAVMEKLAGVDRNQLMMMSGGAFLYSTLQLTEGVGLWFEKRWAEYLTVVATSLFVPLEVYELVEKFTWVRVVILLVNLAIVWYLATRLKDEKKEIREHLTEEIEENDLEKAP